MDLAKARQVPESGISDARDNGNQLAASAPVSNVSRLECLRSATRACHAQLDQSVSAAGYFDTPERYGLYLARTAGFQHSFDSAAAGIRDAWLERWNTAQRMTWLRDDLHALGLSGLDVRTSQVELQFSSPSHLLGGLYVVIGAGLGARVLVQRAAALRFPDGQGTRYLERLSTTTRWAGFVKFLEETPAICAAELTEGALATFACVAGHFSEQTSR